MPSIILVAHNVRSTHNVGSLLRTADGLGVDAVILTGYTPYPVQKTDERLPHEAKKVDKAIAKTALGAEKTVAWQHQSDVFVAIEHLRKAGYRIVALEQAATAVRLPDYKTPEKIALIVGREVDGIEPEVLKACDATIEIPMLGTKESFNVAQAAAMALYHFRYR